MTSRQPASPRYQLADDAPRRARMVAKIRALADLIETRHDIPVPQSCRAQFTVLAEHVPDLPTRLNQVKRIAAVLGCPVRGPGAEFVIGDDDLLEWVAYVVHAAAAPAAALPVVVPMDTRL